MAIHKTSSQWNIDSEYGMIIPSAFEDLWHPTDFDFAWNVEEITEEEFLKRTLKYMIKKLPL